MSEGVKDNDLESQQFLSVEDYRPEDVPNNIKSSKKINQSPLDDNNDEHSHPFAAFFTVIFKLLALIIYIFGTWLTDNFVLVFVLVILCLAADFWTVKNITGRLLVGLRWWNEVKEDGTNEWKFESRSDNNNNNNNTNINSKDSRLFWAILYVTPSIWLFLTIAALVKFNFSWIPLTIVSIALNAAQFIGYWKCQKDANQRLKNLVQQGATTVGMNLLSKALSQSQ